MKKILAFVLVLVTAISVFVSCTEEAEYENIEYKENGLQFVLPNTMRRKSGTDYEFYFTNQNIGVVFCAKKLTDEVLEKENVTPGINAGAYVDLLMERNGFDKDSIFYTYFKDFEHYNFRYTFVEEDGSEVFFYVTVIGGGDNLWYVEMRCDNELSLEYIPMFERWRKTVSTY